MSSAFIPLTACCSAAVIDLTTVGRATFAACVVGTSAGRSRAISLFIGVFLYDFRNQASNLFRSAGDIHSPLDDFFSKRRCSTATRLEGYSSFKRASNARARARDLWCSDSDRWPATLRWSRLSEQNRAHGRSSLCAQQSRLGERAL